MSEVESINPNVAVTSNLTKDGTIEADATSGPLSFDELEEVTMSAKKSKAEKKEVKNEESKQEKSKDLTSDTDKVKKEAKPKETEPKTDKKAETTEDSKPQRKTIKAKYADSELDLDEEAVVSVKINGKEELVPIKDLMGNYSGKVAWDKKFSEIDQTRKQVAADKLKIKEVEDLVRSIYEEGDSGVKMFKIAQLAGVDPVQFRQKFFDENISLLEKYYSMSEDERKADALAYEANIHKLRADTLEKSIKEKQDFESLQTKVSQLRERHQVSEQEFVAKFDELEQRVMAGQLRGQDITPETIIEAIKKDRLFVAAYNAVDKLNLDWDQQTKIKELSKLVENSSSVGLNPNDMAEIVDELWGVTKARNKIEQKKKENQEFLTGKKEVQQAKSGSSEVWSFDQI